MKRPFMYMIIPFIIGIWFCYKIHVNTVLVISIIVISILGLALAILKEKGYGIALILVFFILGGFITNFKLNESKLMKFVDEEVEVIGVVKEVISQEDNNSKYIVETSTLSFQETYDIKERMIVKALGDKTMNMGDKVMLKGILRQPNENSNPGLFDYRLYLQTSNVFTSMTVMDYQVKTLDEKILNTVETLSSNFRAKLEKTLDENLNEDHSSLMKSMLLGESSYLDDDMENKFRELGLAHVLAVSGLHIGIISVFLMYTLSFVGLSRRKAIILTVIFIWIYGFLISYPTSVLRASIMFSFLMLANIIYRRYDPINIISLSAGILLIYNPLWLFSVGFQFSFVATLSLFIFTHRIQRLFPREYRNIGKYLSPLIAVQVGITPVIIYHFNYFSTLSIISNLIIVPILSLALIIAFVIIILSFIPIGFAGFIISIIGLALSLLLNITAFFTQALSGVPINSLTLPSPSMGSIITYYLIWLIALRIVNIEAFSYNVKKAIFVYICLFTITTGMVSIENSQKVKIEFIDVGQGDCSLITSGGKSLLVDGGGTPFTDFDVGEGIVLPYLQKKGIKVLDGVFISHFDADHCEGIMSLLDKIPIKNVFIGYENTENEFYDYTMKACKKKNIPVTVLNRDDEVIINNNLNIKVLSSRDYISNINEDNNLSIVMMVNAYDRKVLFTGDIEKKAEDVIIDINEKTDIDIIKVPHHGSKGSSGEDLIDYFQPEYAVIQVGKNFFGHPHEDTLKRYDERGIEVFRNDTDGHIEVVIDNNSIEIKSFLPSELSLREFLLENSLHIILFLLCLWIGKEIILDSELSTSKMEGTII